MANGLIEFYRRHRRWTPIGFFISGFIFDAVMLRRVDEWLTIVQQAVYLILAAYLIRLEMIETQRDLVPHPWIRRVWHYREDALHFLMGTLLNAYTIFYFKSASAITSLVFIGVLVLLLVLNEFGRFGKSQQKVHIAFLTLCLISYFVTLVPIIIGFIGMVPFLLANGIAIFVFYLYLLWMRPVFHHEPSQLRTRMQLPFLIVMVGFSGLYFSGAIPPVPLSVRFIGIYHEVQKFPGGYELSYDPRGERFWQHGDQIFYARPNDTIYCFARVFSPSRFKDQLQVHWLFKNAKNNWESRDRIPFPIEGGREGGFRGVTKKSNYEPGEWRVQIETNDGREVGRLHFVIETDTSPEPRALLAIIQ